VLSGDPDSTLKARAESLLTDGRLREARALVERGLRARPRDPALLMLLGRVHLDWPVVGRHRAWRLFEDAARRAPGDPAPRYLQIQTGLRLGGDDGERLARDAALRILEIQPDYRDVWAVWTRLYRSDGHRRQALRALERHPSAIAARRRAELCIELGRYDAVDSVLAGPARAQPDDPAVWALLAQAALEGGDTAAGALRYARAVSAAARDTAGILWSQIAAIASPEEEGDYAVTPPAERPRFFRGFWNRREPDLTTPENERLVEHFRRLREARRRFRLLHPQSLFHRSAGWRALQGAAAGPVSAVRRTFGTGSDLLPGRSVFEDEIQSLGLGVDARDLPEPDSVTRYARYGLDGRGLVFLRFGPPRREIVSGDVESWQYDLDGRRVSLVFARATATAAFDSPLLAGDFVIYPTTRREVHNAALMLETDETSVEAVLRLAAWTAHFRSDRPLAAAAGFQDVIVAVGADTAVVALWDAGDREVARARGAGPLVLQAQHGTFRVGADARVGGRLGRIRGRLEVPLLSPGWLGASSLLVGVTADTAPGRLAMARAMPADLVIRRDGRPLALYFELYDLPDREGLSDFLLEYAFEPVEGGSRVSFAFARVVPAAPTVVERLLVQPGQVRPGTYRVSVTVRDRVLGLRTRVQPTTVTLR
jgi:GWxTD domain-containing protein